MFKKFQLGFITDPALLFLGAFAFLIPLAIDNNPTIKSYVSSLNSSQVSQIADNSLVPAEFRIPAPTEICAGKGGPRLDGSGQPVFETGPNAKSGPRCGTGPTYTNAWFDSTRATPNNTVYCGKEFAGAFECLDGTSQYIPYPNSDKCSEAPWCPTNAGGGNNTGGGGNSSGGNTNTGGQGTLNATIRVVTNGTTYNKISLSYTDPSGSPKSSEMNRNGSDIYTFSVPIKAGTSDVSAAVYTTGIGIIKDSSETCRNAGGTASFDCKITVTNGGTATQNFTMSLDPEATGYTPPASGNPGSSPGSNPGNSTGVGEACTGNGTLCGGDSDNACYAAKDAQTLHCCRFTERYCAALGRCVNGGTIEFQNCGKVFSSPTSVPAGYIDRSSCNGEGGSASNHCDSQGRNSCCADHHMSGGIGSSSSCRCVPNPGSIYASTGTSQSVASSESSCSKNSDCKKLNKTTCVLNNSNTGVCE